MRKYKEEHIFFGSFLLSGKRNEQSKYTSLTLESETKFSINFGSNAHSKNKKSRPLPA